MEQKSLRLLLFLAIILLLGACTPQKNLIYFQSDTPKDSVYTYVYPKDKSEFVQPYTLTENDELFVNVMCGSEQTREDFKVLSSTVNYSMNETALYMTSFTIDSKGYISFPIIGEIYLKGLTLEEARVLIEEKVQEYAYDAIVTCKLVNFRVEILGEINRPNVYTFSKDKVSIFDVISTAGDLTYHANRKAIKIIRKENNRDIIYTLDLRRADILQDPNFFLKSGDIVFVEPNKVTKDFANFNIPMSTIASSLSIISTAISLVLLILTIKGN
ncbi:MAG: polysaccharide biosynthesis/export family protein [Bacteroidales bacterium]|nr:polysaccharide biosynthesis/export family protein [Bacteroidales bacterium]